MELREAEINWNRTDHSESSEQVTLLDFVIYKAESERVTCHQIRSIDPLLIHSLGVAGSLPIVTVQNRLPQAQVAFLGAFALATP